MNILIVGAGKVGSPLAAYLSREDHNVTIIDQNDTAIHRASDTLDVMCIKGPGAAPSVLREAGVEDADLVLATTNLDEVNMLCALTAKRLGAKEVYIVYRRSEKELPARAEEVHHAKEEGIIFKLLNNPVRILGDGNFNVIGIECLEMTLGEPDESGRRRPVEKPGSEFVIDVDCVIMAIGTSPNPLIKSTTDGLEPASWGGIIADEATGATSIPGVYAGGDAVTGAATVILAMGAGKTAAASIDQYLQGK